MTRRAPARAAAAGRSEFSTRGAAVGLEAIITIRIAARSLADRKPVATEFGISTALPPAMTAKVATAMPRPDQATAAPRPRPVRRNGCGVAGTGSAKCSTLSGLA